ncbi:MAG: cupin domain-containing protein [Leptospirales bacterium]|nr:cupin domain-containing protein [Leptospirales bacterium]
MAKQILVPPGGGLTYDWTQDHVCVKCGANLTEGRTTVVEDTLKPGFHLARHHHRQMTEIFYILKGSVTFRFDDETIEATPGATVNIPPTVWHEVMCKDGGQLITVFSPGGFDQYLAELAAMSSDQLNNEQLVNELGERYDIWLH